MYGGSTSSGGRWSLGAKTYRAPTEQERLREAQDRLARENERRKLHVRSPSLHRVAPDNADQVHVEQEIKHQEKHIRQQRELAREVRLDFHKFHQSQADCCVSTDRSRERARSGLGAGRSRRSFARNWDGRRTRRPLSSHASIVFQRRTLPWSADRRSWRRNGSEGARKACDGAASAGGHEAQGGRVGEGARAEAGVGGRGGSKGASPI